MLKHFLIASLVAATPAALLAHHGAVLYEMDPKKVFMNVEGPLTDVNWGYPHITAKIAYQGKIWKVVFAPAAVLGGRGITKELLSSAKTVKLIGQPRRDGTAEIRGSIQLIDGKKY